MDVDDAKGVALLIIGRGVEQAAPGPVQDERDAGDGIIFAEMA